jgi:hypothetical protein
MDTINNVLMQQSKLALLYFQFKYFRCKCNDRDIRQMFILMCFISQFQIRCPVRSGFGRFHSFDTRRSLFRSKRPLSDGDDDTPTKFRKCEPMSTSSLQQVCHQIHYVSPILYCTWIAYKLSIQLYIYCI